MLVRPPQEGVPPGPEDPWWHHLHLLQQGGLRNVNFEAAMTRVVLPVLKQLVTALTLPYVVSRGVVPQAALYLRLPVQVVQYANVYAYAATAMAATAWQVNKQLCRLVAKLHAAIRDDKYLLGRELDNFSDEVAPAEEQPAS